MSKSTTKKDSGKALEECSNHANLSSTHFYLSTLCSSLHASYPTPYPHFAGALAAIQERPFSIRVDFSPTFLPSPTPNGCDCFIISYTLINVTFPVSRPYHSTTHKMDVCVETRQATQEVSSLKRKTL